MQLFCTSVLQIQIYANYNFYLHLLKLLKPYHLEQCPVLLKDEINNNKTFLFKILKEH